MLPLSLGMFSVVLKRAGSRVELFDTIYYAALGGDHAEGASDQMEVVKLCSVHFRCLMKF